MGRYGGKSSSKPNRLAYASTFFGPSASIIRTAGMLRESSSAQRHARRAGRGIDFRDRHLDDVAGLEQIRGGRAARPRKAVARQLGVVRADAEASRRLRHRRDDGGDDVAGRDRPGPPVVLERLDRLPFGTHLTARASITVPLVELPRAALDRLDPVRAVAEVHLVAVDREDLFFRVALLDLNGEDRFLDLALDRFFARQPELVAQVARDLLGERARALRGAALDDVGDRGGEDAP